MKQQLQSALYEGQVYHQRLVPRRHAFTTRVYYLYLDLAELPELLTSGIGLSSRSLAPLAFRRRDYLKPVERPLAEVARERAAQAIGRKPEGAVRLLTQLRTFGYGFNPVSFYYCFATPESGEKLEAIVAEITNTPWGERHTYVLDGRTKDRDGWVASRFEKAFHVSPFWGMQQSYSWRLSPPGERLEIHMRNLEGPGDVFHAGLRAERRELAPGVLRRALLRHPLLPWRIHGAIYFQAARLWLKGVPFHTHPKKRAARGVAVP